MDKANPDPKAAESRGRNRLASLPVIASTLSGRVWRQWPAAGLLTVVLLAALLLACEESASPVADGGATEPAATSVLPVAPAVTDTGQPGTVIPAATVVGQPPPTAPAQLTDSFEPIEAEDIQSFFAQLPYGEQACLLDIMSMERMAELKVEEADLRAFYSCLSANTFIREELTRAVPKLGGFAPETLACFSRHSPELDTAITGLIAGGVEHPGQQLSFYILLDPLAVFIDWMILSCLNADEAIFSDRHLNEIEQLRCLVEDVGFVSMVEMLQFLPGELPPEYLSSQFIGCGPFGETILSKMLSVDWRTRGIPATRLYTFDEEAITRVEIAHNGHVVSYARRPDRSGWVNQDDPNSTLAYHLEYYSFLSGVFVGKGINPERIGLEPPRTVFKISDENGNIVKLHLGAITPDGQYQYGRISDSQRYYWLHREVTREIEFLVTDPPYAAAVPAPTAAPAVPAPTVFPWVFGIDEKSITFIQVIHGDQTVSYVRYGQDWVIQGTPEVPVDLARWAGTPLLLSSLPWSEARIMTTEELENLALLGLDSPETVVRLTGVDGNSAELHIGAPYSGATNHYARLDGGRTLYTVPSVWAQTVERLATDPPYSE